jgi:hypothetical protein
LKMYEKGGFIDVVRVQNTNRNIVKFRFVWNTWLKHW